MASAMVQGLLRSGACQPSDITVIGGQDNTASELSQATGVRAVTSPLLTKTAPSRTLDLHGRTAARAFHAFTEFLHMAHAEQHRCIEIITGRGTAEGGVLKREFPLWLNLPALRPLVLAASHPHAANSGSVRLLLRRPK